MSPETLVQHAIHRLGEKAEQPARRYRQELEDYAARAIATALLLGKRVKVYRNLHRSQWSLMATEGPQKGRVIGWADELWLTDPTLTVSEAGRQRVIREKQRNVHAFVIGNIAWPVTGQWHRIRYNPFRAGCFTDEMGACVVQARVAYLDTQGFLWMDQ